MKLLLIDYLSPQGHIKFDRIHIKSLQLGNVLDVVGKKGHFKGLEDYSSVNIGTLPDGLYINLPFKAFTERLLGLLRLLWICRHYNVGCYDAVIFLSYDIFSLFVYRKKGKVYLINHNNVSQLSSRIKLFLTRTLPTNYVHVVLNKNAEAEMKRLLHGKIIEYVPHGYEVNNENRIKPDFIKEGERFIFCPVNRNYDKVVVDEIFRSPILHNYLEQYNITLYHKIKEIGDVSCEKIKLFVSFLTVEEYSYLISQSVAVLLPYGNEFKFRCSGIFFECIADSVPVVAPPIPDLTIYRGIADIYFFNDVDSFIKIIESIPPVRDIRNSADIFQPDEFWKKILFS